MRREAERAERCSRDSPLTSITCANKARGVSQISFGTSRPREGPWSLRDAGHSAEDFRNNNRLECCRAQWEGLTLQTSVIDEIVLGLRCNRQSVES